MRDTCDLDISSQPKRTPGPINLENEPLDIT